MVQYLTYFQTSEVQIQFNPSHAHVCDPMCHNQSFEDDIDFEEKNIITKREDNNRTRRQEFVLA